jgi:hypothetical protein
MGGLLPDVKRPELDPDLHLVSRLRIRGALPPLVQCFYHVVRMDLYSYAMFNEALFAVRIRLRLRHATPCVAALTEGNSCVLVSVCISYWRWNA